ncbi:MAG: hypothetical protein LBU04_07375 [Christensenellaceae bacterium]|jgi:hypothetical protein|nr:hypothetical protein [Christensenellaceae bacterium]
MKLAEYDVSILLEGKTVQSITENNYVDIFTQFFQSRLNGGDCTQIYG